MSTLRALFKARLLRGLLEGSRLWLLVGGVVAVRKLSRRLKEAPEVVYCGKLERGQSLLIRHVPARAADAAAVEVERR